MRPFLYGAFSRALFPLRRTKLNIEYRPGVQIYIVFFFFESVLVNNQQQSKVFQYKNLFELVC